jgi:hypothetical protein
MKRLAVLFVLSMVSGCSDEPEWGYPYRSCIRDHVQLMPMAMGKFTLLQPQTVCDEYSADMFIRHGSKFYRLVPERQ